MLKNHVLQQYSSLLIAVAISFTITACGTNPVTKKKEFNSFLKLQKSISAKKTTRLRANHKAAITLLTQN